MAPTFFSLRLFREVKIEATFRQVRLAEAEPKTWKLFPVWQLVDIFYPNYFSLNLSFHDRVVL